MIYLANRKGLTMQFSSCEDKLYKLPFIRILIGLDLPEDLKKVAKVLFYFIYVVKTKHILADNKIFLIKKLVKMMSDDALLHIRTSKGNLLM